MYIIKNAFHNLGRNKGRNLLLGVVLFFIIAMAAVSIVVQSAANLMIDDYKTRFGSQVFLISKNTQQDIRELGADMLLRFGESDLLQSSEYTAKSGYTAKGLKALGEELEDNLSNTGEFHPKGTVYGSSRKEISDEFQNGTRVIVSGRKYQNGGECMISKKFADLNGLSLGDRLTLEYVGENGEQQATVCGIYDDLSLDADTNAYGTAMGNRANDIFTAIEPILASAVFPQTGTLDATFFLKDPSLLSAFHRELTQKGLPSHIQVKTDESGYRRIIAPVEGLKKIAAVFLLGVLILGSVVLILISILAVRERKYEVGVLRAMGLKRGKVALGMLSEVVIITVFCLFLGLGTAAVASKPITGAMLQNQLKLSEQANASDGDKAAAAEKESSITSLRPHLDANSILWIVLLSGALAVVSSLSGVLFIMRYEPRRILSERD
ncbi:MAG: ABC transporter permease [Clostridia bacterium]